MSMLEAKTDGGWDSLLGASASQGAHGERRLLSLPVLCKMAFRVVKKLLAVPINSTLLKVSC